MLKNKLWNAIEARRSFYALNDEIPYTPEELKELIDFAVMHVPSAFNCQSTRTVFLAGKQHHKLWDIVKEELREIVPAEAFQATEQKIDTSFKAGYGTILYFIDDRVTQGLMKQYPTYAKNFPIWAEQSSGMHQYAIWTMLVDLGLGVSVQHYNPLIDEAVYKTWNIDRNWRLIAQMPFGKPIEKPGEKTFEPIEERSLMFK